MAKMARLFSASDMSAATWLLLSATRGGFSVTQRDDRGISSIGQVRSEQRSICREMSTAFCKSDQRTFDTTPTIVTCFFHCLNDIPKRPREQ